MNPGKIEVANKKGTYIIKLSGDVRLNLCSALENYLEQMFTSADFKTALVDLTDAEGVDSTTLGQLAKISIVSQDKYGLVPSIISPREDILRLLLSMGFDEVFNILEEMPAEVKNLDELSSEHLDEEEMRETVIEAHEVLISLNEENKQTFQELVDCLHSNK